MVNEPKCNEFLVEVTSRGFGVTQDLLDSGVDLGFLETALDLVQIDHEDTSGNVRVLTYFKVKEEESVITEVEHRPELPNNIIVVRVQMEEDIH